MNETQCCFIRTLTVLFDWNNFVVLFYFFLNYFPARYYSESALQRIGREVCTTVVICITSIICTNYQICRTKIN